VADGASPGGLPKLGFAALLLAAAQAPLGSTLISIALPSISRDLRVDLALATHWLVTSYLIVSIVGQSPGGRLGDVLGQLRAVRLGMGLQALGGCLGLLANHLSGLVIARCCIALGGALVVPATVALLRERSPAERRGRLFGWLSATLSLSAALGPPLGGELLGVFGWRAMFGATLALWLASALASWLAHWPAEPPRDGVGLRRLVREFDVVGTLLVAAALAALLFGSRARAGLALCGFAGIGALFVLWERGRAEPVFDPQLFEARGFAAGTSVIALQNFVMYGLLFQLPNFFVRVRAASPQAVGHALFSMLLAMFVASPLGGRLCDRVGPRASALCALAPLGLGSFWLQRIESFIRPLDAIPALLLLGVGMGLLNAPCQTAAMSHVPSARAGLAAGASSTLRYLGGVLSIFMLRVVLDVPAGASALQAHLAVVRCFALAAVTLAAVCLALPDRPV
jgi:MFS family permease